MTDRIRWLRMGMFAALCVAVHGCDSPTQERVVVESLSASSTVLDVGQEGSASVVVTIARTADYTGSVALSVETGDPLLVATFDDFLLDPHQTSATLTVTAAANAAVGKRTVRVSARANDAGRTLNLTVNIRLRGIALHRIQPDITVVENGEVEVFVSLSRVGNYHNNVSLTLEGVPPDIVASWRTQVLSGTDSSTFLRLRAIPFAVPGIHKIAVVASGIGTTPSRSEFSLTIVPTTTPFATISVSPTGVSTLNDSSATATVNLLRGGGYTGPVSLAVLGLPSGATADFDQQPVTGNSSVLTIRTAKDTPAGAYTLVITGNTDGVVSVSTTLQLVVKDRQSYHIVVANKQIRVGDNPFAHPHSVFIVRKGGFNEMVVFSIDPLPPNVIWTLPNFAVANVGQVTGYLSAGLNAPFGEYRIRVRSSTAGGYRSDTSFVLTINPSLGSFSLVVQPSPIVIARAGHFDIIVRVETHGEFNGSPVHLSFDELPNGLSVSYIGSQQEGIFPYRIFSESFVQPGSYPVVLRGRAAGYADVLMQLMITVY